MKKRAVLMLFAIASLSLAIAKSPPGPFGPPAPDQPSSQMTGEGISYFSYPFAEAPLSGGVIKQVMPTPFLTTLEIRSGGTYTGKYFGIEVQTKEPVVLNKVTIEGGSIRLSAGANVTVTEGKFTTGQHHFEGAGSEIRLRIYKSIFEGRNPNKKGETTGRAVDIERHRELIVQNCNLNSTTGIRAKYAPPASLTDISYNDVQRIDGRISDGAGGYQTSDYTFKLTRQFVIFRQGERARLRILYNRIINRTADYVPLVRQEDIININSSGTEGEWLLIKGNLIVGSYNFDPTSKADFSGTGIITDGRDCKYIAIVGNYVIGTGNVAISLHNGKFVRADSNVAISSARVKGGVLGYSSVGLSNQFDKDILPGFRNNLVHWVNTRQRQRKSSNPEDWRMPKHYNFSSAATGFEAGNNVVYKPTEDIGLADEKFFIDQWEAMVKAKKIVIGAGGSPPPPGPTPDPPGPLPDPDPTPGTDESIPVLVATQVAKQIEVMRVEIKAEIKEEIEADLEESVRAVLRKLLLEFIEQ